MSENQTEDLESFRLRARAWLADNIPKADADISMTMGGDLSDEEELKVVQLNRDLQRKLFDGGFAGLCFPKEYGGQGLPSAYADVFNDEISGYMFPWRIQVPTFTPCAAVLLEFGTEEQKLKHIPAILKGEELWMQFLSEPSGGSDAAGALTTAVKDGDEWVLNGSKIWTTGAWWSDWGLCLARTNWDVPKHRGLTVFILPIHQPGIEINRIEMLNGSKEFCQEYITDVRIPDSDRVGEVNDGWTVGIRWMFYERSFHHSDLTVRPATSLAVDEIDTGLLPLATKAGRHDDPAARELVGEAFALKKATQALGHRIPQAMMAGTMNDQGASLGRLMAGISGVRETTIEFEIAGSSAVTWAEGDALGREGEAFLMRQSGCIGGGTTEMARNVISERVLLMPRERSGDKDIPFRDVERGRKA
jgi:alkylation response protein AidB-like acyl-CoA dehydrogenase